MTSDAPTLRQTRENIKAALREIIQAGGAPGSREALADAVAVAWKDASGGEKEEVASLQEQAFGSEVDDESAVSPSTRPPFKDLIAPGFFSRFLEYTSPGKSSPQLCFGALITLLSAGFKRSPMIDWSVMPIYPNLYTMLVGGTGAGKGIAIRRAKEVCQHSIAPNILPREGSHQGYADRLASRYEETGYCGDGLIIAPELRVILSKESNHKQEMVTWLTDWFDEYDLWDRGLRSDDSPVIRNPYVCFLGASNIAWLRMVPEDAILGGFFPRFLMFDTPETEERSSWGKAVPRFNKKLRDELEKHLMNVAQKIPDEIKIGATAEAWLERWHGVDHRLKWERAEDETFKTWLERKQAALMKVACIMQLVEGGPQDELVPDWLEKAKRVVDWCDYTVLQVYPALGMTPETELPLKVHRVIQRRGGEMSEREIVRSSLKNGNRAYQIVSALSELQAWGEAVSFVDTDRGKVWRLL